MEEVRENAPDWGGVAVPAPPPARKVIPTSPSSSSVTDILGDDVEEGGKESPNEESRPERDEIRLGLGLE